MTSYLEHLKRVTGSNQQIARVANVVGASGSSSAISRFLANAEAEAARDVPDGVGTVAGAAVGALVGMKRGGHPVLGAIGGASLGRNMPALLHPADRRIALCNMGETGFAMACSLAAPRHPAIAFVVGDLIARAVIHFGGLRG